MRKHSHLNKGVVSAPLIASILLCGLIITSEVREASAQGNEAWSGGARGTAANAIGARRKVAAYRAKIYTGPSTSFNQAAEVYSGEFVVILQVTQNQEWAKVKTPGGKTGWILISMLERIQDKLATDPGRRRRQTEYQYDAQGRRIRANGSAIGSGQGAIPTSAQSPQSSGSAYDGGQGDVSTTIARSSLRIELSPGGASYLKRRFSSDIGTAPLSGFTSSAISPSFGLRILSDINDYVNLEGRFVASLGSSVNLPAAPTLIGVPALSVDVHQYTGDLQASAGAQIGDALWGGGIIGVQYYELGYKEVTYPEPATQFAPLQTHSYLAATVGARLTLSLNWVMLDLRGGVALPLSFTQAPNSEGKWSGLGLWSRMSASVPLSDKLSLGVGFGYARYGSELTGPAAQADYTRTPPIFYNAASTYDESIESLLFVGYQI